MGKERGVSNGHGWRHNVFDAVRFNPLLADETGRHIGSVDARALVQLDARRDGWWFSGFCGDCDDERPDIVTLCLCIKMPGSLLVSKLVHLVAASDDSV